MLLRCPCTLLCRETRAYDSNYYYYYSTPAFLPSCLLTLTITPTHATARPYPTHDPITNNLFASLACMHCSALSCSL